jgi:hypothetical protein
MRREWKSSVKSKRAVTNLRLYQQLQKKGHKLVAVRSIVLATVSSLYPMAATFLMFLLVWGRYQYSLVQQRDQTRLYHRLAVLHWAVPVWTSPHNTCNFLPDSVQFLGSHRQRRYSYPFVTNKHTQPRILSAIIAVLTWYSVQLGHGSDSHPIGPHVLRFIQCSGLSFSASN